MAVSMEDVLQILEAEEPDYESGARLGPEVLPHLETLINGPDVGLAAKAASLAGLIGDERSVSVLEQAARRQERVVRVAAAAGARNLPESVSARVLLALLEDEDAGVRKVALSSAAESPAEELRQKVAELRARGEGGTASPA
jgi:HEAT repeat protein